jgi:hypothetical protein
MMTFKEIKSVFTDDFNVVDVNGYSVPVEDVGDDVVVTAVNFDNNIITLACPISAATKPETKFYFPVGTHAEGCSGGYVLLTQREADIVAFATNYDNWKNSYDDGHSGGFYIGNDNPIPVDKFEKWDDVKGVN